MKLRSWIGLLAIAIVVAGCGTASYIDSKERTFQRVGVLSVSGAYLAQMNVGITVFGNEKAEFDVAEWKLDPLYATALAAALRSKSALQPVVLENVPAQLGSAFKPSTLTNEALSADSQWEQSAPMFRKLVADNHVDALVLLTPAVSNDFLGNSNQVIRGLGIYTRSLGSITRIPTLHLACNVVVVSADGKVVARHRVRSAEWPHGGPKLPLSPEAARTPFDSMTPEQKSEVRAKAEALPLKDAFELAVSELLPGVQQPVRYQKIDLSR